MDRKQTGERHAVTPRLARRSIPTLAAFLLTATLAFADTHYVDINNAHPKWPSTTWETASTNIQMAVHRAREGDTVLVADGFYEIDKQIVINKSITLKSANGPATTTINANGKCRVIALNSTDGPITLDGFTVTGGYADYGWAHGGGIAASGEHSILISNCIISDNEAPASGGGINIVGSKETTASIAVINCIIWNNRAGVHGGGIHIGIWKGANNPIIIKNCTIVGNRDGAKGSGLSLVKDRDIVVENIKVMNSIIYGNQGNELRDVGREIVIVNSCLRNAPIGRENVKSNPKFVNPDEGDFRLRLNSPCIDAGSNDHVTHTNDLAGNTRIMDADQDGEAVVDMGAYEYVVIPVDIDIRPGTNNRAVNLEGSGLLPVAILSTESFSVTDMNPASIRFAGEAPVRWMLQDVDGDGDVDLLLQFKRQRLKLNADSTHVLLTGQTKDKQPFIGEAPVDVVTER